MKTNESYKPWRAFVTTDVNGVRTFLTAGKAYHVASFDELIDPDTGNRFTVAKHIARNPDWYFNTGFGSAPPRDVTHVEYVAEIVRGEAGLDRATIWDIVQGERFQPVWEKPICSIDSLSAALTIATAQKNFEMHDREGNVVKGKKHATCCTFHPRTVAKRVDGWAA